jgi:hypothetical protein
MQTAARHEHFSNHGENPLEIDAISPCADVDEAPRFRAPPSVRSTGAPVKGPSLRGGSHTARVAVDDDLPGLR